VADTTWTSEELANITTTEEVHVSSVRRDGSLSPGMTIWAVSVDGDVFIRSTDGPHKPWFRAARNRRRGQLAVGAATYPVQFLDASDADRGPIDAEYRRKYRHRPAYNVNRAAGSLATLQLVPVRPERLTGGHDGSRR
jgi:hypothetical protein